MDKKLFCAEAGQSGNHLIYPGRCWQASIISIQVDDCSAEINLIRLVHALNKRAAGYAKRPAA